MIALEPRPAPSLLATVASPLIAVVLTIVIGAAVLAAIGQDVGRALWVLFVSPFSDAYNRAELLVKAIPLALIGGGLAVCFRANVWNIGAAGQYTLGAVCATAVALAAPDGVSDGPFAWAWFIAFLAAGALGGLLWAAIPALLRTAANANEILVSLMLTYVAAHLLDYFVRGPWRDPLSFGFPQTETFQAAFRLTPIVDGTRLHGGLWIAIAACVILGVMMARSLKGFELRLSGAAPRAAAFAGFKRPATIWFALLLSGGLAGLAGAIELSATLRKLQPEIAADYGFTAIIVAFVGRLNPIGALFGALVLSVSYIGGENAQILLRLPANVAAVFQGMLLFLLLACDTLIHHRLRVRAPRRSASAATSPSGGG